MVLRADPCTLLVSEVATVVARDAAAFARTFRGPGAFARGDQLVRATLSVVSNITGGCGRGTVPEFRWFSPRATRSASSWTPSVYGLGGSPGGPSLVESLERL